MNQNSTNKFLFIDIETNGLPLSYNKHYTDINNWPRIVQIAWIICDDKKEVITERCFIIKPIDFDIPDNVVKVHGITKQIALAKGLPIAFVLNLLEEESKDCTHFVAHNIAFDAPIIKAEFLRANVEFSLNDKTEICTMQSSIEYCGFTNNKYPKLEELYFKLFNKKPENLHDALQDIKYTKDCFFELYEKCVIRIDLYNSILPKLIPFRRNKHWGYCNKNKEIIIDYRYKMVSQFNNEYAIVTNDDGMQDYINIRDELITDFKYKYIDDFHGNIASVWKNYRHGFVNKNGEDIIPCKFEYCKSIIKNAGVVKRGEFYALVNDKGVFMSDFIYDNIIEYPLYDFYLKYDNTTDNLIIAKRNNIYVILDETCKERIVLNCSKVDQFSEGLAAVRDNVSGNWGYINNEGVLVIPYMYDEAKPFSEGIAFVKDGFLWLYIDKQNNILGSLSEYQFYYLRWEIEDCYPYNYSHYDAYLYRSGDTRFCNGLAKVVKNNKVGFINSKGEIVIPFIFDEANNFSENIASVSVNNLWGCIDINGNIIIPFKYKYIYRFHLGQARVITDHFPHPYRGQVQFMSIIDTSGKIVYSHDNIIYKLENGLYGINKIDNSIPGIYNERIDFIDMNGNEYFED
ncbi:MAG: WG repeat-containing protein [Bacteroidetes bacterium]|nr:WG repeat-containing protein [Bacteroidota bacterium]